MRYRVHFVEIRRRSRTVVARNAREATWATLQLATRRDPQLAVMIVLARPAPARRRRLDLRMIQGGVRGA